MNPLCEPMLLSAILSDVEPSSTGDSISFEVRELLIFSWRYFLVYEICLRRATNSIYPSTSNPFTTPLSYYPHIYPCFTTGRSCRLSILPLRLFILAAGYDFPAEDKGNADLDRSTGLMDS